MTVKSYSDIIPLLADREEFESRTMSAKRHTYPFNNLKMFNLNEYEKQSLLMYRSLAQFRDTSLYVVYSYRTPIAWAVDGLHAHLSAIKYSATTAKHQKYVRNGIDREIREET